MLLPLAGVPSPALQSSLHLRRQLPRYRFRSPFSTSAPSLRCHPSFHLHTRLPSLPMASSAATSSLQHQEKMDVGEMEVGSDGYGEEEEAEMIDRFKAGSLPDISADKDTKHLSSPEVEVTQLEDLPEQWKRSRIAWLCKELPSHKQGTLVRILNAQRKWIRQAEATYVIVHCMRIRENEAAYRVYSWMAQQHWFHFDFALATKLADYLGKARKFAKCRDIFDTIIKQGRVPNESTFHILAVAYLSAPVDGCLEEACFIYNQMIQIGGYRPRLSLHNSLFRALLGQPRRVSKHHLKQAEFIYHNLVTCDLEVQSDIYSGLIWLHSSQDTVDRKRIDALRDEMGSAGVEEGKDVLMSILRACSKQGDVEEAEKTWVKLIASECALPSQAFVYRMELYSKARNPMKSLEIFKEMKRRELPVNVSAYHKIIEVMTKADEVDIAETLVDEFIESGMKPLTHAFHDLMRMYLKLEMYDRLETAFSKCLTKSHPNRNIYSVYLDSLVMVNNLEKAEQIFNEMHASGFGANAPSCNIILRGYLAAGVYEKAANVYVMMHQKGYDVEPDSVEKIEQFLHQNRKHVKKSVSLKLNEEQREMLTGLLLGGAEIVLDVDQRKHAILFKFNARSNVHSALRMHIHERFYEWLTPSSRSDEGDNEIPYQFSTIFHACFSFFADQFLSKGRPSAPKLIHRWLSARVLAYWYMYGGFKLPSEDILLKLRNANHEDIGRIVKTFQVKDVASKVKRKGRFFWIGFQGSNAALFWKLVEPYALQNVNDLLIPRKDAIENHSGECLNYRSCIGSDSDERECRDNPA